MKKLLLLIGLMILTGCVQYTEEIEINEIEYTTARIMYGQGSIDCTINSYEFNKVTNLIYLVCNNNKEYYTDMSNVVLIKE